MGLTESILERFGRVQWHPGTVRRLGGHERLTSKAEEVGAGRGIGEEAFGIKRRAGQGLGVTAWSQRLTSNAGKGAQDRDAVKTRLASNGGKVGQGLGVMSDIKRWGEGRRTGMR